MKIMVPALLAAVAMLTATGCGDDSSSNPDASTDTDTDGDTDTDSDTDTDTDTDTGSDTDTDGDTDTDSETDECASADTFNPSVDCPDVDGGLGPATDGGVGDGGTSDVPVRYVDNGVITPGDGTSWATAFNNVQEGINACRCTAIALGTTCQVWVVEGTYMVDASDQCNAIRLRPNVELYGGFTGVETSLESRDWEANVTTLDGGGGVYHVVRGADNSLIDGFTITGGNADGTNYASRQGGGMLNLSSSPTVANNSFNDNTAVHGGGMYNVHSSPLMMNSVFSSNTGTYGGGLYNLDSSPTLTGCTFTGNLSETNGGGIFNYLSSPIVTGCMFLGNSAQWGGGMSNFFSEPFVTDCTFSDNSATIDGGGLDSNSSCPVVSNCEFSENSAEWGGGIFVIGSYGGTPEITNCLFSGNSANWGGAMHLGDGSGFVTNCVFSENIGGMACVDLNNSSANFTNCSFLDNTGVELYVHDFSSPVITNSVVWGSTYPLYVSGGTSYPMVTYSDVQGGYEGEGNIDLYPLFVDAASGDFRLQADSPCIDTGSNDALPIDTADLDGDSDLLEAIPFDLDGNPRIVDGNADSTATVDMGAYEYQP